MDHDTLWQPLIREAKCIYFIKHLIKCCRKYYTNVVGSSINWIIIKSRVLYKCSMYRHDGIEYGWVVVSDPIKK